MKKFTVLMVTLIAFLTINVIGQTESVYSVPAWDGSKKIHLCEGGSFVVKIDNTTNGHTYNLAQADSKALLQSITSGGGTITFDAVFPGLGSTSYSAYDASDFTPFQNFTSEVVADPIAPTLSKSPNVAGMCEGTNVSASKTDGSGGVSGCTDTYQYRTNGGSWQTYSPGSDISTTGVTSVEIQAFRSDSEGRGCMSSISSVSWVVYSKTNPTISGDLAPCFNSNKSYSTEAGMTGYNWSVTNGTIASGSGTATISVDWDQSNGTGSVSVYYTDGNSCTSNTKTENVDIKILPIPNLSGQDPVCAGTTHNYSTDAGMSGYTWSITGGSGSSSTNTIEVTWGTGSSGQVSVSYTDGNGCNPATATVKNITINALPVPTISGQASVCANSTHTYSTQSGMSNYIWNLVNGEGSSATNDIDVTWNNATGTGSVFVTYTDGNTCTGTSAAYNVSLTGVALIVGGNIYCTLQEAIDAAAPGQTVVLLSNVTEGMITINKVITLDGGGYTLNSTSSTYGISVASNGVTIQNLIVDNPETYGIMAYQSNNLAISTTTVSNCGTTGSGSPFASGFALNCCDNITLTNITAANNEGNGVSITDCDGVMITGITTSGNSFGTFGAGIGIYSGGGYCTPAGSSNITIAGTIDISEVPAIYEQIDAGGGTITGVTLPSAYDYYMGLYPASKYYFATLPAALAAADQLLAANPAYLPALYVKEVDGNNLYIAPKNFATINMSIQTAINVANPSDVVNVYAGTYTENIVVNKSLSLHGANADVACGSRGAESKIAPPSGLPFSVTADGVTINGFEITAPSNNYAINGSNTSNLNVLFNYIHHVGSSLTSGYVHAVVYQVANATATADVSISDNCFSYIGSSSLTGSSATAIGILQSTSTGVLTNLFIERNTIDYVEVNTGNWPTGKIAYGIQLNTGAGNYTTTNGKIVNAQINDNTITHLKGFISTGIGLEGNTENAVVEGNTVAYLTGYKLDNRAGGGYDLNALKFETNRYVGTVTVQDNSFRSETFTFGSSATNNGYAVANYVPMADGGIAEISCNWLGTANYGEIVAEYTYFTGKVFNKEGAGTDFIEYLTTPTIGPGSSCNGTNATPDNLNISYTEEAENVVVTFDVAGNSSVIYPIPGLTEPAAIAAKYAALQAALTGGDPIAIKAAALEIGDDIITEYYYMDGTNKVYLQTAGGNPLVKNKYWDEYLNNTSSSLRYPSFTNNRFVMPIGNYSTSTNPNTGGAVNTGWLAPVYGKTLYVTVTFLHNGEVNSSTQTVLIPAAPVVNITKGLGYLKIQTAIANADPNNEITVAAGTYVEVGQIVIDKNLTITGADKSTTIIKPDVNQTNWFQINTGVSFNLSKVKLDGTGKTVTRAINYQGNGVVNDCWFTQIKGAANYDYGTGVQVKNPAVVDITNCIFDEIGRSGIRHEGTGTVSGNTYTGKGTGDWLDYFILAEYGCDITIDGNIVTNCIGVATLDGSTSSAIAVWDDPDTKAIITNNILTNNTSGIGIEGINSMDPNYPWPQATIGNGNIITGGEYGLNLGAWNGSKYNPILTFGSTTLKGQTVQAIWMAEHIGIGSNYDISSVIIKDVLDAEITDNFEKEDFINHALDGLNRGLFVWVPSNVYVTTSTLGIQRGIDVSSANWTVNIGYGNFNENVNLNKNVIVQGQGPANTILSGTSCLGNGVTISASDSKLRDLKVTNFSYGVAVSSSNNEISNIESVSNCNSGLELSNGTTNLTVINSKLNYNQNPAWNATGFRKGTAAVVNGFIMINCEVKGNDMGCFVAKNNGAGGTFDNVSITYSNFSNNLRKGMYFEALGNAMISDIVMGNSGTDPNYNFNNGIDINLKYGNYSDITIQNSEFNNCGLAYTGTPSQALDNPCAITIKARDDGGYASNPATLNNVIVQNNIIQGPRNGIRFGETGKVNAGPTSVTVYQNDLGYGFAYMALINNTNENIIAECNWWGSTASGTIAGKISGLGTGIVDYDPWIPTVGDNAGLIGFQPSGTCTGTPVVIVSAIPTHILCGPTTGSIEVTWSGGTAPYNITWSGGSATNVSSPYPITPLLAGTYSGTVTDANGSETPWGPVTIQYLPVTNTTPDPDTYWPTVQAAVTAATAGDNILICDGLYKESNITVNKPLTIEGQSKTGVILAPAALNNPTDGSFPTGYQYAFLIGSSDVIIKNLTIDGEANTDLGSGHNYHGGVMTDHRLGILYNNILVQDIIVQHTYRRGIQIFSNIAGTNSSGHLVTGNTVQDVTLGPGIVIFDGHNTISNNTIQDIPDGSGIEQVQWNGPGSVNTIIKGNVISNVYTGIQSVWASSTSMIGGTTPADGNTISLTGVQDEIGIILRDAIGGAAVQNNIVTGTNGDAGIWLYREGTSGYPVLVKDNALTSTSSSSSNSGYATGIFAVDDKVFVDGSTDNNPVYATISNNKITGFQTGVELHASGTEPIGMVSASILNNEISGSVKAVYLNDHNGATNGYSVSAIINNNNLSGNTLVVDASTISGSLVDATCNWWGTVNSAEIDALTFGDVQYLPFWVSDTGPCEGVGPVVNVTRGTSFMTIQEAIDDPATVDLDVIEVAAGTYAEDLYLTKSLDIRGPNYNVSPNGGTRVAEAIIVPATSNPDINTGGQILYMENTASGTMINGFTFDGDNPLLTSGVIMNGADVDVVEALSGYNGLSNVHITNNIFQNINYAAIDFYNYYNSGNATTGNLVQFNKFDNIVPSAYGIGVIIYNNCYTKILDNVMTRVRVGIQTGNFYRPDPGDSKIISGNIVQASRRGIFHNLAYSNASAFTISNNSISAYNYGTETVWDGILLSSLSVPSFSSNNTINGTNATAPAYGYQLWNVKNTNPASVSGGSVTGVNIGIFANNFEGYSSNGTDGANAVISGLSITPKTGGIGIKVYDSPSYTGANPALVHLDIQDDCSITGGLTGILAEGDDASVSITDNLATITGNEVGIRVKDGADLTSCTGNTITNNTHGGIIIESTAGDIGEISGNVISGNGLLGDPIHGLGLKYDKASLLDAEENFWGDATGPYHVSYNTCGLGNAVTGNVDFMPWYVDEDLTSLSGELAIHNITSDTWYCSIQDAIDDADPNDEIKIEVATHTEGPQIVVEKNITLKGLGKSSTTLNANGDTGSSGDARGWILVNSGVEFNMQDLTLDGNGNNIMQGVRSLGTGTIDNVVFNDIKYPGYNGIAVVGFGNLTVQNSDFTDIGRIGIIFFGAGCTNGQAIGNTYTGKGAGDWIDYAVEVGGGAVASITDCYVSGNTGVALSDGSTSAAIIATTYYGAGTTATITGCTFTGNTTGIDVGFDGSDVSVVVAHGNQIYGNSSYGIYSTGPDVDAENNWWGSNTGPTYTGNPCGTGNAVSANVDYDPWWNNASFGHTIEQLVAYTVSGTTSLCIGGTTDIELSDSQLGIGYDVVYSLYADNVLVPGTAQTGTGDALSWTIAAAENTIYTVKAVNSENGCILAMNGSAAVYIGPVTTAASVLNACPGSTIQIPVTVTDFANVGAISLTMNYDATVLTYVGSTNAYDIDMNNFVIGTNGTFTAAKYLGPNATPMSLPDGSTLLTISFIYNGGTATLAWDDTDDAYCEYAAFAPGYLPFCDDPTSTYYINGQVSGLVQPVVAASVTGPDGSISMTSGNNYSMTICSGEEVTTSDATSTSADPSSCGVLWVEMVYTTDISTLPATQTFNAPMALTVPASTSITPENHDGIAKNITFVATPYYDVDGSGTLTAGDYTGLPITYVLTVEPTPIVSGTVTGPLGSIPMTSGNSYAMTICSGEQVTTSDATSTSVDPSSCGPLWAQVVYTTTISTLPPTMTYNAPVGVVLPSTSITPENHDGVAKTITFVSTPYYDVDGSFTLTAGDVVGLPITFVLTVEPTPIVSGTVTGPLGSIPMTSGNSYAMTICSGEQVTTSDATSTSVDPSSCGPLWVQVVYNTTISTLPPTQTYNAPVGTVLPPTSITPENHDGVAKTITFVSTPYYDVDGSMTLTAGDVVGLPITFVLTVEPTPIVSGTVTGPLGSIPMTSGNSYAMTICSGEQVTTSDATSTSADPSACGPLWVKVVYTTDISTLPPSQTFFAPVLPDLGPTSITPENHDNVVKSITFVSTPFYDVNNNGSLDAGDVVGLPITFVLTVNPEPTVVDPANQYLCNGASTGDVIFSGPVIGTTYSWTNDNTSIGLAAAGNGDILSFTATNTGVVDQVAIITVTPSANGCAGLTQTFTITVYPTPAGTIAITTPIGCNGGTGTVTITATVGTAPFSYTFDDVTNSTGVFAGIEAGTGYQWYITDAHSCVSATGLLNITEPSLLTGGASITTEISCFGGNATVTMTAGGGTTPYTYIFNGNSVVTSNTSQTFTVIAGEDYAWSVNDANLCGPISGTLTVTEPPLLTGGASITTPITCYGGTATVTMTAGGGTTPYTYVFNGSSVTTPNTTQTFMVVAGVDYAWSVDDANSCGPVTGTLTVTEPSLLTGGASVTTEITCNGGSAIVTMTAGGGTTPYTYVFDGSSVTTPNTTQTFTVVAGVAYTWSVNDANSCGPVTGTLTVTEPSLLTGGASITTEISCFGGNATVTMTAGGGTTPYTYIFNGNLVVTSNTSQTFTVIAGVDYSWSVNDANSCGPISGTLTVTEPPLLTGGATITTPIACYGGSATVTMTAGGGTTPYTYTFNGNSMTTVNTSQTFTVVAGVGYAWSVTDANSCGPITGTLTVTEPSLLTGGASVTTQITCKGGTAIVTMTAGGGTTPYTYIFNGNTVVTPNNTQTFNVLAGVAYSWSVNDANLCGPISGTLTVTEPPQLTGGASITAPITCFGGSATVTMTAGGGTAPYTYVFNGIPITTSNTSQTFTVPAGVDYPWSVTDANLCGPISGTLTVTEPPQLTGGASITTPIICFGGSATVTMTAGGGTTPYTYVFNGIPITTSNTSQTFTVVAGVDYAWSVDDANSCGPVTGTLTVTEPSLLTGGASVTTQITCFGGTAMVTMTAGGGTTPYTYIFNGNTVVTPNTSQTFTIGAGVAYAWSVNDANLCGPITGALTVTEPALLTGGASVTTQISCYGGNATVTMTAGGGTAPYTYVFNGISITTSNTSQTFTVVAGVAYPWSVNDANSCGPISGTLTVTEPPLLTGGATITTPIACYGGSATVTMTAGGGTTPYTYTFNGNSITTVNTSQTFTVVAGVGYAWSVTDANNCGPITGTLTVTEPSLLTGGASVTTPITCFGGSAIVTMTAGGGTPPYSYTFNGITNGTGIFTGILAGVNYPWSVTDAYSCGPVTGSLTVTEPAAIPITGTVKYYNGAQTVMNNVIIDLKQGGTVIHTATTNGSGVYTFANVCPGTYDVEFTTIKPTGGINATDAALVNAWPLSYYAIERVQFLSGDVTGAQAPGGRDNKVLSGDAGRIQQYFLQQGNPMFTNVPKWSFWSTGQMVSAQSPTPLTLTITVPPSGAPITQNFWGMVTGDFGQSFVPGGAKDESESLTLEYANTIEVESSTNFELPIRTAMDLQVGAVSLVLNYPSDQLEVTGVYLTDNPEIPVEYTVYGDELRIAWYALNPVNLSTGDALVTLKLRSAAPLSQETMYFSLAQDPLNELANGQYSVINPAVLTVDIVKAAGLGIYNPYITSDELTMSNYPNPFNEVTTITYILPKDGKVTLDIHDLVGNKVSTLVDELQTSGEYRVKVNLHALQVGSYTATLKLQTDGPVIFKTIKIISK